MHTRYPRISIHIQPGAVVFAAFVLLILPMNWVFAWLVSSAVHEIFHLLMVRLLGITVYGMEFGVLGAKIQTEPIHGIRELLCTAAGPLGGGLLILLGGIFPRIALCAFVQTAWNLLPIYPLDGGRCLRCLARLSGRAWAERICGGVEAVCLGCLLAFGIYGTLWLKLGILPVLAAATMIFRVRYEKYLANH